MGFDKKQFRELIIETLEDVDMMSDSAVNLLMGTAAQESHLGTYLRQVGGGPALGVFQMEPATHEDIWDNYLEYRMDTEIDVKTWAQIDDPLPEVMVWNLKYAIIMARLHYRRVPEPLPGADDVEALGRYWKQHYNTPAGKGTAEEFVENYNRFVK